MRKLLPLFVFAALLGIAGFAMHTPRVHAAGCPAGWLCYPNPPNPPFPDCKNDLGQWMWYHDIKNGKGYFTKGAPGAAPCNVLGDGTNALNSVNDAAGLISTIQSDLNGGDYPNSVGAAFIIDYMLGYSPTGSVGAGITNAQDPVNLQKWKDLVNYYANPTNGSYGIIWSSNTIRSCSGGVAQTSAYSPDLGDDVFYTTPCGDIALPEIVFFWDNGNSYFAIGKPCGNVQDASSPGTPPPFNPNQPPVGSISIHCDAAAGQQLADISLSDPDGPTTGYVTIGGWRSGPINAPGVNNWPLPGYPNTDPYNQQTVVLHVLDYGGSGELTWSTQSAAPCVTLTCGGTPSFTPAPLDPFMTSQTTVTVTNNVGVTPPGNQMRLQITAPSGGRTVYDHTEASTGSGGASSATFDPIPPLNAGVGMYTATWTLTSSAPGLSKTCSAQFPVVDLPYLNVYGGDVSVGASPVVSGTGPQCSSSNSNAGIFSWNNYTNSFSGAGAQYAVQALATIEGFASAQDPTGGSGIRPPDLSLANTGAGVNANPTSDFFGGSFGAVTGDCDFTTDLSPTVTTSGNTTIGATVLRPGTPNQTIVYYVTGGDVYLSGNIQYDGNSGGTGNPRWNDPTQIPYFKLVVVGGNIYVGQGVTQLDGIYVAEPNAVGTGGVIYTCAHGNGNEWKPNNEYNAGYYSACGNQLTINGSFVAKQVQFLRTGGSLGQAATGDTATSSKAAEVFHYTPELWLPRGGIPNDNGYKAITGLPPIL